MRKLLLCVAAVAAVSGTSFAGEGKPVLTLTSPTNTATQMASNSDEWVKKTLYGVVIKRLYAKGSKSERMAIMLRTDNGDYLMRRRNGSAFAIDPVLAKYVGKKLRATGFVHNNLILLDEWKKVD